MARLLEIKASIVRFYAKFDTYINMLLKFILAMTLFLIVKNGLGYMKLVSSVPIILIIALICCLLPLSATLWIGAIVVLLDLYSLTKEAALVGLVLFAVIYFIYFRFTPKDSTIAVLTPVMGKLGIPYVMPVMSGLLRPIYSVISIACGTIVYYFLDGIRQNAAMLTAASENSSSEKLKVLVGLIADNKEMDAVLISMVLASLVIYLVRRLKVDYAWTIALVAGVLVQLLAEIVVSLILSVSPHITGLVVGSILALILGMVLQFFCMNLDYQRVERVQYEDDEYYYYVTAVPKRVVAAKEKQVKQFGNTGRMPRAQQVPTGDTTVLDRKALAQELDIDEDLLK